MNLSGDEISRPDTEHRYRPRENYQTNVRAKELHMLNRQHQLARSHNKVLFRHERDARRKVLFCADKESTFLFSRKVSNGFQRDEEIPVAKYLVTYLL